jgi:hypothetical protein
MTFALFLHCCNSVHCRSSSIRDKELMKNAKYLGLSISHNLSWNHYIGTVTKKVNNINAFLSTNISSCPRKIKAQCYTTLVRPIMEYACIIWDPVTQKNIRELEMVQRRANRNYSAILATLQITSYALGV